jgi:hypothetical protein
MSYASRLNAKPFFYWDVGPDADSLREVEPSVCARARVYA